MTQNKYFFDKRLQEYYYFAHVLLTSIIMINTSRQNISSIFEILYKYITVFIRHMCIHIV